jgi:hypothetical protein
MRRSPLTPSVLLCLAASLSAQLAVPFPRTPTWESDRPGVSTGGAFVDLDRDGAMDLVIANGNDIRRQPVVAYRNAGDGTFPAAPTWSSADIDYHGHLDVGDVDGDGWPDLAVAVFLGPSGFGDPGRAKLYLNDGQGNLGATPAWTSADRFMAFRVALGDVDLDGDLDLAVATGEPYYGPADFDRVYLNRGGSFPPTPDWTSATRTVSMDLRFCDVDADGDLDLAFAGAGGANRLHFNQGGVLQAAAAWVSTDNGGRHNSNTLAFGDVDGDGRPDLAVSDNSQLGGGRGTFRVYRNLGTTLGTTPWWESARFANGYTSGCLFLDYDLDGDLDLVGGGWWTPTAVFRNDAGQLGTSPAWQTSGTSVVENLFVADLDRDALRTVAAETFAATGRRLFTLRRGPVQALERVEVDGAVLSPQRFAFHRESGTLSLATAPTAQLRVRYSYSEAPDLGVSNWDQDKGNHLFLRRPVVDLATAPTSSTRLRPGGILAWTDTVESTVAVAEPIAYWTGLELPGGLGFGTLHLIPVLYPAGLRAPLALSLPLPAALPPVLIGRYEYRARLIDADGVTVIAEQVFPFEILP